MSARCTWPFPPVTGMGSIGVDLREGVDVLKPRFWLGLAMVLATAVVILGMRAGMPTGLVVVLFAVAVLGPIVGGRWLERTRWLELLPRERRVRITLLLPVVVVATGLIAGTLDQLRTPDRDLDTTQAQVEPDGASLAATRMDQGDFGWASRIGDVEVTGPLPGEVVASAERSREASVPGLDQWARNTTLPRPLTGLLLAVLLVVPTLALVLVDVRVSSGTWRPADAPLGPGAWSALPGELGPLEVAGLLRRFTNRDLLLAELVRAEQQGLVQVHLDGDEAWITPQQGSEVQQDPVLADLLPLALGSYDDDTARRLARARWQLDARARGALVDRGLLRGPRGRPALIRAVGAAAVLAGGWWLTQAMVAGTRLSEAAAYSVLMVFVFALVAAAVLWWGRRPAVTPAGQELLAQAELLHRYVADVEQESLRWPEQQPQTGTRHPALVLLPYALALGLSDRWWTRFGDTLHAQAPDDWALSVAHPGLLRDLIRTTTVQPLSVGRVDRGMIAGPGSEDGLGSGGAGNGDDGGDVGS